MTLSAETMSPIVTDALRASLAQAQRQVNGLVLGKAQEVRLAFVALLAGGHVLIEDLPGLGKTTLAHALAATVGLSFQRIQFTSDLLPADVLGVSVYEAGSRQFQFHPGPVFTQVLLADEMAGKVRIGKYLELELDTTDRAVAEERLKAMCEKLLANTVVEDYRFELEG